MKKEDFLKLMDGIDDRLVEKYAISDEAEARQKQIRRQRRQRWLNQVTGCAVAAIILGVIGVAMLCASFGIVRMDRQSQKTPVSLGDGSDSQNNENNGDEEKELLLQAYLSYIGVEEQDIQEIQKMNQQIETIILTKGDSEQQSVSIETAVYLVYTTNQDKVLAVLAVDLPDKAVGLVETCEPIPETHLHVCQVNAGEYGTMQICCGADNVQAGGKYPVALVGATVYATAKDHKTIEGVMTIKKGKLRGFESYGMLCSGTELGLTEDLYPGAGYNGLLEMPADAQPGADVKAITGLDDWMFDISLTANRPDCQSILGIAREVSAMLEKPLKMPSTDYTETDVKKDGFKVSVEAPDLCPRYSAHYVYDVKMGESPAWMKRRLALVGIGSISNIVDITNYVLKEIGQPMHAFDCSYLEGNEICVRRAHEGEKIVTLDEQEYTMSPANLVICDGVKPVALAGVMGGLNSEIRDTTESVMFEAAKFARDNVRKTARALGKSSDSSSRFEKGVDEYSTVLGMKRALHLIEELGCGKVSSTHVDVNVGNSIEPQPMQVSIHKVNSVLGIEVPAEEIVRLMKNLNFNPTIDGDVLTLQVPAYREDMLPEGENDVERYPDVAEEVIRMYGYDHIKSTFMPSAQVTAGGYNKEQKGELALKRTLCTMGAYECMHYSFFSPSDLDLLKFPADAKERFAIQIMNPINIDLSLMHPTHQ
jgi:phenylalanyl-tRNA synthetase beta chain